MQKGKQYITYEDNNINMTQELIILHLIYQNDLDQLKNFNIKTRDVNFLQPFVEIEIDTKITPLICASYLGRFDIVKMLLDNPNLDIDQSSQDIGHTPLTIACSTGNYEILRLLLLNGAEVNQPTKYSQTAFVCCFQRLEEEMNVFENRKICLQMAELLLFYGADINWIVDQNQGYTLLMQLCSIQMELTEKEKLVNYEIIQFLIENGVNQDIKTEKGKGAKELCQKHCNKEMLQDLLENCTQIYFYQKLTPKDQLEMLKAHQEKDLIMQEDQSANQQKTQNVQQISSYFAICNNN